MALYNLENGKTCTSYLAESMDETKAAAICVPYDFTNVDDLMLFVNGTWYGDYYIDSLQATTGLTQTECSSLFD